MLPVEIPKGLFVEFKPLSSEFMKLANPLGILRDGLNHFNCVTQGNIITITHEGKDYLLDTVTTKPSNTVRITDRDADLNLINP